MARPYQQPSHPACSCSQPAAQQAAVIAELPKHSACFQVSSAYHPASLSLDPSACDRSMLWRTLDAYGKHGYVCSCNSIIECRSCQRSLLVLSTLCGIEFTCRFPSPIPHSVDTAGSNCWQEPHSRIVVNHFEHACCFVTVYMYKDVDNLHACAAQWECIICYLLHLRLSGIAQSS